MPKPSVRRDSWASCVTVRRSRAKCWRIGTRRTRFPLWTAGRCSIRIIRCSGCATASWLPPIGPRRLSSYSPAIGCRASRWSTAVRCPARPSNSFRTGWCAPRSPSAARNRSTNRPSASGLSLSAALSGNGARRIAIGPARYSCATAVRSPFAPRDSTANRCCCCCPRARGVSCCRRWPNCICRRGTSGRTTWTSWPSCARIRTRG